MSRGGIERLQGEIEGCRDVIRELSKVVKNAKS
jgi:hypothetical protein